jgi:hypothetical protein
MKMGTVLQGRQELGTIPRVRAGTLRNYGRNWFLAFLGLVPGSKFLRVPDSVPELLDIFK